MRKLNLRPKNIIGFKYLKKNNGFKNYVED